MENEDIYQKATKKVKAKKGFFYHFLAFAFTIGILYAIMYFENGGDLLPVIVTALGWGIGLAVHYFKVFGTEHLDLFGINPNWEENELKQEIAKLKRTRELKEELQKEKNLLEDLEDFELKEIEKKPLRDEFL
ncbi:MAG: hypothetical protein Sapg2KO_21500 [Saprospiraceae bacterium]